MPPPVRKKSIGNVCEVGGPDAPASVALPSLSRASRQSAVAILAGTVVAMGLLPALPDKSFSTLMALFFWRQDVIWLALGSFLMVALPKQRPPAVASAWVAAVTGRSGVVAACLAIFALGISLAGTYLVFRGFHLSRDELMAEFDATIMRSGAFFALVPLEWRELSQALVPDFLLPVPGGVVWMSNYLPVNAALRALVGFVHEPEWTNPLLAAVAVICLNGVVRRLWPGRPDAVVVCLVLFATSSQFLVTAMTSYAMTGHLALNLLWLWLFLRDDRGGHAAALAVGFLACGLHQVVFHPLFAAPFVLRLWQLRRRRLALVYTAAYAVMGVFWIAYWRIVLESFGISQNAASGVGAQWSALRALSFLIGFGLENWALVGINLLRFVAWQHILLVPLAIAAAATLRKGEGIAPPLASGIALTLMAVLILMPHQGYGWGYRYLHGMLGSVCILAGYGWIAVTTPMGPAGRTAAQSLFGLTTAVTVLVSLPIHVAQAERFIAPYRAAVEAIESASTDLVFVDRSGLLLAADLVRNDPFLRNRPKVLDIGFINDGQMRALCSRFSISVFGREQAAALAIPEFHGFPPEEEAFRASRRALMAGLDCGVMLATDSGRSE